MYPLRNVLKKTIIDRNSMLTRSVTRNISAENKLEYIVKHDPSRKQFYIELNADKAFVEYDKLANILDFYETYVPENYRGKGVGSKLAEAAFSYAVKENHKIQLSCSYLQKFYHENYEKYKDYVLDDEVIE